MNAPSATAQNLQFAGTVSSVKDEITASFTQVHERVQETAESLESFIALMDPYVNYFFSGGKGDDTFLGDVVLPAERDLNAAVKGAVEIMNGDAAIHETIFDAISRTQLLQNSIDTIVDLLESMEIYSLNTMIMSGKSGNEGLSLATISQHMAALSRKGGDLSTTFTGKMSALRESLEKFSSIRSKIEILHETNLTSIQLNSSSMFKKLSGEFARLSGEVLSEYGMIQSVSGAIRRVTEKFQYEDILRQNLEKIIFASESASRHELVDDFSQTSSMRTQDAAELFNELARIKLCDVKNDFSKLSGELDSSLSEVQDVLDGFSMMVKTGTHSEGETSGDMLLDLCGRLESMKTDFENYIAQVLEFKNRLFSYLKSIDDEMQGFRVFFNSILEIAKQFQTIILLTKIDLASHEKLQALLGGTLSDVSGIPVQIRKTIEELMPLYAEVTQSLEASVLLYRERFEEQKAMLSGCVESIRKVSVQIYESKKYHDDFLLESLRCTESVNVFLRDERSAVSGFLSSVHIISGLTDGLCNDVRREDFLSRNAEGIKIMQNYFSSKSSEGDYRNMMLASLAAEFVSGGKEQAGGTIEFF